MKNIMRKVYKMVLETYDNLFSDRLEISVGDIMLQRGDVILNNQLLLTSRYCDVVAYCEQEDKSFPYQNAISRKAYGEKHFEERGNMKFAALIKSYHEKGYDPNSFVTVDKDIVLLDGNHRMGLHIFEKIDKVNIRRLHRKPPILYGVDWYYRHNLPSNFLEKLHFTFSNIQQWLIETGNTFVGVFSVNNQIDLSNIKLDMSRLCRVLKFSFHQINDRFLVVVQFSMPNPKYVVKNQNLVSIRAEEIEMIMRNRYINCDIKISKNCLEGKELVSKFL